MGSQPFQQPALYTGTLAGCLQGSTDLPQCPCTEVGWCTARICQNTGPRRPGTPTWSQVLFFRQGLNLWAGAPTTYMSGHAEKEMRNLPGRECVNWRNLLWLAATILLSLIIAGVWTIATAAERFEGQPEIVDADTFRFGGTKLRLWGVDAPESGPTCLDGAGRRYVCGSREECTKPRGSRTRQSIACRVRALRTTREGTLADRDRCHCRS